MITPPSEIYLRTPSDYIRKRPSLVTLTWNPDDEPRFLAALLAAGPEPNPFAVGTVHHRAKEWERWSRWKNTVVLTLTGGVTSDEGVVRGLQKVHEFYAWLAHNRESGS